MRRHERIVAIVIVFGLISCGGAKPPDEAAQQAADSKKPGVAQAQPKKYAGQAKGAGPAKRKLDPIYIVQTTAGQVFSGRLSKRTRQFVIFETTQGVKRKVLLSDLESMTETRSRQRK